MPGVVGCPECGHPFSPEQANTGAFTRCEGCSASWQIFVFPAAGKPFGPPEIQLSAPGEASCFFHSDHRVNSACERCGRFLCTLCSLPLGRQMICPECLQRERQNGLIDRLLLPDNIALFLAIGPTLTIFFSVLSLVTVPLSFLTILLFWRSRRSRFRLPYLRFGLAFLFGFAQIAAWILLGALLYSYVRSNPDLFRR